MLEKNIQMSIKDTLGIVIALLKTINMAIGNIEYFGDNGQNIAITLDIVNTKLEECRKLLIFLDKDQKNI